MVNKFLAILFIGLFCTTLVSAVWWNPWTWWDDPENNTEQEGQLFIIEGESEWNVIKHTQEIDYNDDGLPDVISTFTEINETLIEVFVNDTVEVNNGPNAYKWISVICNISGFDSIQKEEYNPSTEVWTNTGDLNYEDLQYTHPEGWCNETGGYGFTLYGSGSGDKRYRLILPEGEKELKILAGDGTEEMVIEYQNISTLLYNLSFGQANITLFKNVSGNYNNTINDLFVYYNNDSYKFGATDFSEENGTLNSYKYQIKSNIPINKQGNILYLTNPKAINTGTFQYFEQHEFDFVDICSRGFNPSYENVTIGGENFTITTYNETANCEFTSYQIEVDENNTDYYYEVSFLSDKYIDPTISIGSSDWIVTSLLTNITAESGDANFTHLNISDVAPYDSLIGYWNFDGDNVNSEGATSYDWTKEGNDGTMVGNAVVNSNSCVYGDCLQLDGAGDYVNTNSQSFNSSSGTISVWVNGITFASNRWIISDRDAAGDYLQLVILTSGATHFRITSGGDNTATGSAGDFVTGQWYHIVATWGSEGMNVSRNNVNVATNAYTGTWTADSDMLIGMSEQFSTLGWNGEIDEVMIFNTALTAQQILDIYNNASARFKPTGTQKVRATNIEQTGSLDRVNLSTTIQENMDSRIEARVGQINLSVNATGLVAYYPFEWGSAVDISGEGNDGVIITGIIFNETGGQNSSGGFDFEWDANGGVITLPNRELINGTVGITVSAWIKAKQGQSFDDEHVIEQVGGGGTHTFRLVKRTNELFYFYVDADSPSFATSASTVPDTDWHHVVGTYNGSHILVTVDGVSGTPVAQTGVVNSAPNSDISIGSDSSDSWNGTIDTVMIWNRSLSPTEITDLYNNQSAAFNLPYYTDYQNITTDTNQTFTISTEADFVFPYYNFFAGNSTVAFYSSIIQNDIFLNAFSGTPAEDTTPPTWSDNQTNNTVVSQSTNFSLQVNDETALESNGQYIFSTNNTGTWTNDSAVNFTATPSNADVIKVLNSTVGISVGYRWYLTDNAGNVNDTDVFSLITTTADTCTYTSGNWNIDCSDNCNISDNVNLGGNNITITGTGIVTLTANITNYIQRLFRGTDTNNKCIIRGFGGWFQS